MRLFFNRRFKKGQLKSFIIIGSSAKLRVIMNTILLYASYGTENFFYLTQLPLKMWKNPNTPECA